MAPVFKEKILVTIGRESGSGGRKIGILIGEKLGIPCYDQQLLDVASNLSGLSQEVVSSHDEKTKKSFLYSLVSNAYNSHISPTGTVSIPMEQRVFLAEHNAIKDIADRESAVIVGRCSDYALQDYKDMISIFIMADPEDKVKHVMETYGYDEKKAKSFIAETDKSRKSYYEFYTNRKWGQGEQYDLIINRSPIGIEGAANLVVEYIKEKLHFQGENK